MPQISADIPIDEKCHYKYIRAAWTFKGKCMCAWVLLGIVSSFKNTEPALFSQTYRSACSALCHTCLCTMQK